MRQMIKYFSLAIFAVLFLSLPGGLRGGQSNGHTGSWASSNQLLQARSGAASELLADGRILVTGGADQNGSLKSAEYIAADGSVSAAPPMQYARSEHASVLLPDGRVLVAGGIGSDGAPTNSSEIFDPAANSWTTTGAMVLARSGHTASLLPNGKVLIAGGEISSGPTFYLEVFDPESNAFSLAGALLSARAQHGAVVLEDGRVLIIGGTNGSQTVASTEIFDGDTQSVSPGPDLAVARENFSVTRLLDGRILVAGGNDGSQDLSSAEVFDPAAQNASLVNSALLQARSGHLAFLLPHNNGVLIVGGSAAGAALSSAELYLPWRNAFVSAASLGLSLEGATGQPLQGNGLLLVAGGKTPALSLYRGTRASRDGAAPAPQALAPQGPPAMVAVGNTEIYQFATLVTDQDSYAPGDAVAISGTGWQAGETVTLLLHQDPQSVPDQTLQATADGAGNIAATMISPDSTDPDVTYYLTATGKASEAQAKFTGKRSTTTAVNSSNNPSLYGEAVTFTAVVSAGPGKKTPNGSVQFQADGVNLGAPITTTNCGTNGSACAYITTLSLTTGSHAVQAIFTGTGNSLNSTSPVLAQTVQVGSSSTALVSSANPSALGQPVTFTATVSVTAGLPTGSVTFKDGGTVLGTTSLNPGGWTTLSTSALASGAHSITAVYSGDGNIAGSTSAVLAQTVSAGPSTVAVVSSLNPALLGQPVTFTATVSVGLGAGTPTGTVTFKDGATVLGTGALNAGGWTTFTTSALTVGPHSVTAVYGGDTNFGTSTSANLAQTVSAGPSTVAVVSSLNPALLGQPVTFTATVSVGLGAGTPTGTVTFKDGPTALGTGTLNAGGWTTITTSSLTVGPHSVTAVYGGDTNFGTSTSADLAQTVSAGPSTVAVVSSLNPALLGQPVTFTATVSVGLGAGTPTGTVTFKDGTTALGTGALNAGGWTTLTTSSLAVGPHSVTAAYGGDTNFGPSTSAGLTQTVSAGPSTVAVVSSLNPALLGQPVTFTATVSVGLGAGAPTGTVTFKDGATVLGTGALNAGGWTTLTTSSLTVGPHSVTVAYGGDTNFGPSTSAGLTQTVSAGPSTVAVVSSLNPALLGQPVTFTATVSVGLGAGAPTGTVTFKDGATVLGTGTLNAGGWTTLTTSSLAVGPHAITAVYGGDTNFGTSTSTALAQTVSAGPSTVAVVSSLNPALLGQPVTFTATVSVGLGAGTPTGTVTFKDGATVLGTGTLNAGGWTTLTTSSLTVGPHAITAVYGGDTNFGPSTSADLAQTVSAGPSTVAVVSSLNPALLGQPVTFTATVSVGLGAGTPTGTVTFKDGTTVLGTGTLNAAGWTTLATSSLALGPHAITAVYGGDTNFGPSTSAGLTQTVSAGLSTTAVISSLNPALLGQPVTFTATVSVGLGAGTPTGTVTFKDGTTVLGTGTLNAGGWTTLSLSSLTVGSHSITAVYGGDTSFGGSSSDVLTQTVNPGP